MTVTINKTDGTVLTTITDGAADVTTTNLALIGRLYKNYGELVNENFVKLLENFAHTSSPTIPIEGMIWYDKSERTIKIYRSTGFVPLARMTSSAAEPGNARTSDLWWDTNDAQLKLYNGSSWTVIAPPYTSSMNKTGAFAENIRDVTTANHIAVVIYQQNQVIAIFSKDVAYTPQTAITGFTTVNKGLTLSNISDFKMHGTATNADAVDGISSEQFLRSDENDTTTGTLGVLNDTGLTVGVDSDIKLSVDSTTGKITKLTAGNLQFVMGTDLAMVITDSERVQFKDGTEALPAITFIDDPNTGFYRIGADNIGISVNGGLIVDIDDATVTIDDDVSITGDITAGGDAAITGNAAVTGNVTITGDGTIGDDLTVNGSLTVGTIANSGVLTVNVNTMSIPNGLIVTGGNLGILGTVALDDNVTLAGNLTVVGDVAMTGAVVANGTFSVTATDANDFKVDATARVMVNRTSPPVGYTYEGDMSFGDTNGIYARNVAKYVCTFNGTLASLAVLRSWHIATVTRTATGTYTLTLEDDYGAQCPLVSGYPTLAGAVNGTGSVILGTAPTAGDTSINIKTINTSGSDTDYSRVMFAIWDGTL